MSIEFNPCAWWAVGGYFVGMLSTAVVAVILFGLFLHSCRPR